jgi:hypothetical protein
MRRITTLSTASMDKLKEAISGGVKSFDFHGQRFNIHPRSVEIRDINTGLDFDICITQKNEIKKLLK